MIRIGPIDVTWDGLSSLLTPTAQLILPVAMACVVGLACMYLVGRILRGRYGIGTSVFFAQAAGIAAGLACLWGGLAPLLVQVRPVDWAAFGIQAETKTTPAGPFSTEVRCRWYADELARIQGTAIASGNAIALETALKAKAGQDECTAVPRDHYPSRNIVEAYLFRLDGAPACEWAKKGFLAIAASHDAVRASGQARAHWDKARQGGCARY